MFCGRCGEQIAEGSEVCPLCGRPANIELQAVAAAQAAAPVASSEPVSVPSFSTAHNNLQGIGGWLLFFCISLVLLSPLANLARIVSLPSGNSSGAALDLSLAVFGIVVGITIWNVRPIAFTLLWVYFGVVVFMALLGLLGSIVSKGEAQASAVTVSIRSLFYVCIWFFYFRRSERVRATFGRNL
jgi:hypothetical protein